MLFTDHEEHMSLSDQNPTSWRPFGDTAEAMI